MSSWLGRRQPPLAGMEALIMSRKERERIPVMRAIGKGELKLVDAAPLLEGGYRQARRIWQRYKADGDAGLVHCTRGRPGPRRKAQAFRDEVLACVREWYRDFGPRLAAEYLAQRHGLEVDHETLRRWMAAEGLRKPRQRRQRHRAWRERRPYFGQMVQLDGSHHDWFEGRGEPGCLMVMGDDATHRTLARFSPKETTRAGYDLVERWVRQSGLPRSIYADRHSIYLTQREATVAEQLAGKEPKTQFGRAMEQLGIELIAAQSPQAKGRVERMNGTLQDRLVKAMGLDGISDIEQANDYLAKRFLPELNRRFMRVAAQWADLHMAKPKALNEVLSWEEERVVQRDWTVKWKNQRYQLDRRHESLSLVDKTITVRRLRDESLQMVYQGRKLQWRQLPEEAARVKEAENQPSPTKRQPPAGNHPWRRMGRAGADKAWRKKKQGRAEAAGAPV